MKKIYSLILVTLISVLVISCGGSNAVTSSSPSPSGKTTDVSSSKDITAFLIVNATTGATIATGVINEEATPNPTILIQMPAGTIFTDLYALTTSITYTGASINPPSNLAENFVNSVDYVVTAPDGTTKTYTVTVNIGNSSTKDITSFSLTATTPSICRMGVINGWLPVGGGTPTVNTIYVGFDDHNTDVTSLKANFQTSGVTVLAFVNGNWVQQQSNVTINNFTNPITYRVIAENLSYKDYVVSVAVIPAPGGPPSPNFNPTGVCTVLLNN